METAVDFLIKNILELKEHIPVGITIEVYSKYQQAKQLEKEQIMDAFQEGKWDWDIHLKDGIESKDPAQYYNETYKSE